MIPNMDFVTRAKKWQDLTGQGHIKLSLVIKKSKSNWSEGQKIEIYPTGFPKSKRPTASSDQVTYLGQKDTSVKAHNNECDICVNTAKVPAYYGAHFVIKYDWEYNGYLLKDLDKGSLVHYTLMDCQQIPHRMTLCFGNTVLMIRTRIILPTKGIERSAITQSVFSNYNKTIAASVGQYCKSEK
jgi:hypothetical protein